MELRVARSVLDVMRRDAECASPEECCGLLLGRDGVIEQARPAANVATDRRRHFEIDPQALVDAHRAARSGGAQIVGYYHSHPSGPDGPSATDRAMAAGDNRVWAIVAETGVAFWRDGEAAFEPLPYTVEDG